MEEIASLINPEHIEALVEGASQFGFQIIAAIAVFVVGRWLARKLADLLERGLVRAKTDPTLVSFFRNIVYFGLLSLGDSSVNLAVRPGCAAASTGRCFSTCRKR
jgi:small-conductance mechanosensitive channel